MFAVIGALLFFLGAISETTDNHEVFSQGGQFWLLLGLTAIALHLAFAIPVMLKRG